MGRFSLHVVNPRNIRDSEGVVVPQRSFLRVDGHNLVTRRVSGVGPILVQPGNVVFLNWNELNEARSIAYRGLKLASLLIIAVNDGLEPICQSPNSRVIHVCRGQFFRGFSGRDYVQVLPD